MVFVPLAMWDTEAAEGAGGLMVCWQQARILPPNPSLRGEAPIEGLRGSHGRLWLHKENVPCWDLQMRVLESSGRAVESGGWLLRCRGGTQAPRRAVQGVLSGSSTGREGLGAALEPQGRAASQHSCHSGWSRVKLMKIHEGSRSTTSAGTLLLGLGCSTLVCLGVPMVMFQPIFCSIH